MRRLRIDRRDHACRARLRRGPGIDLDQAARTDARAAAVRDAASQVIRRAARFLAAARREPASAADLAVDECSWTAVLAVAGPLSA